MGNKTINYTVNLYAKNNSVDQVTLLLKEGSSEEEVIAKAFCLLFKKIYKNEDLTESNLAKFHENYVGGAVMGRKEIVVH